MALYICHTCPAGEEKPCFMTDNGKFSHPGCHRCPFGAGGEALWEVVG